MADLTTYTCKYCNRKFRNKTKALLHEIEEKMAHNPKPMYSLCVNFEFTNHLPGQAVDIRILREPTYFDDNGNRLEFWDCYRDPTEAGKPFSTTENVWMFGDGWTYKEVNPKEFLRKHIVFRENDHMFHLKIYFTDWSKIPSYLKEIRESLPDEGWLAGFRDYFHDAFRNAMRREIDESHEAVRKVLENGKGDWSNAEIGDLGYGSYEKKGVFARDAMKYGLREKDEGSLYMWLKKDR